MDATTDLADEWGVQQHWVDADDQPQTSPDASVERARVVIGRPPADLDQTAPIVTRRGRSTGLTGQVRCEDGSTRQLRDVLDDDFPLGYHVLTTEAGIERRLIVSPGVCWLPPEQTWGWSVQLYGALSTSSRGIGDLRDLRTLREWTEQRGGGFLLVNPLHAVAPVLPLEASPYLPATRRFRNPVYLCLDDVPGFAALDASSDTPPTPRPGVIDRDGAWLHKLHLLRAVFAERPTTSDNESVDGFDAWRADQGSALEEFATWSMLAEQHGADWHDWPQPLHDPRGDAVAAAAAEKSVEVDFQAWLQWLLAGQLEAASGDLTVIQDLPIGVSGGGADSWAWQGILADGMTVGCPPDALNTVGQDWGSPPLSPWRLRAAGYEPFIESVRATIAGAGGLRIDHVMGLFRLWWIPDGEQPTQGVYVRYPADDLLDIVCLESHRAEAVVVGEDLGTVEDGVAEALAERNIASYRVLWFEDDDPATWPPLSLAAVTTHDLPTVAGLWTGSDTDDQLASSDMAESDVRAGSAELRGRLQRDGLADDAGVGEALAAAYAQLGRSPSLLLALSLEDALHEERRPNVPGTTERDNWRIPLPVPVDELTESDSAAQLLEALSESRSARPRDDA